MKQGKGKDRGYALQEASAKYNEQYHERFEGQKDMHQIVLLADPNTAECVICGQHGIKERQGRGWLNVSGRFVCPACVADSGVDPVTIRKRVKRCKPKRGVVIQQVPILGTIS